MADTKDDAGLTIAANTGFLWKSLSFPERIARAGAAGFDAVEFHDEAQAHDIADVRAALRDAGLPLLGLNARMGDTAGCAGVPGMEGTAREDIDRAIETAAMLNGRAVHVLAGKVQEKVTESEEVWETYRANLAYAAQRAAASRTPAAPDGLTVLIEPLSARAMPGYLLASVARAASVIEWVGASNLKIMFDVFHVHSNGDDVVETYRACAPHIGHVQLAHPETRHEPPVDGEHAVGPMVSALRGAGYGGAFGAEYVAAGEVGDGLGWMAAARGTTG